MNLHDTATAPHATDDVAQRIVAQLASNPLQPTAPAPVDEARFEQLMPDFAPRCLLRITPASEPCAAILTGFAMLARSGRIALDLEIAPDAAPLDHGHWHLRDKQRPQWLLQVEGGGSAVLDPHDSWEIESQDLARHDLYFKRSLQVGSLLLPHGAKLRPLGLLSDVRTDWHDRYELRSELAAAHSPAARLRTLLRWLALPVLAHGFGVGNRPNWSRMHAEPTPGQPPSVLLMAGLWNPDDLPTNAFAKRAEWEHLNRQRVECVRALRREFGSRFHGGIRHSDFARRYCPDVLLESERRGSRGEFLRRRREHPVCVTSMGLSGSNGFRLAEFVAASRAIVSEPLQYVVPGNFAPGTHYLRFTHPAGCVAQVARLFERPDERDAMMRQNWEYLEQWQRPERLALRLVALTFAAAGARRAQTAAPTQAPARQVMHKVTAG